MSERPLRRCGRLGQGRRRQEAEAGFDAVHEGEAEPVGTGAQADAPEAEAFPLGSEGTSGERLQVVGGAPGGVGAMEGLGLSAGLGQERLVTVVDAGQGLLRGRRGNRVERFRAEPLFLGICDQ
jgi:hypothetical protein